MRISRAAVALALGSLLAGCTATAPLPDTSPSTSATQTPSATTAPILDPALPDSPTPRYALTCDELVPDTVLTATFGDDDVLQAALPEELVSPLGAGIRQQGGLNCTWENDELRYTAPGYANSAFKGLDVLLAPDPDGKWVTYATMGYPQDPVDRQFGSGSGTACFAHQEELTSGPSCSVNVLVGRSWLDLMFYGIEVPTGTTDAQLLEKMRPVIAGIVERIPDPRPPEVEAPDLTLPECDVTLPVEQVLRVLEISDDSASRKSVGYGGYSLTTAAREYSGMQLCMVGPRHDEGSYAATYILPGGAWAFRPSEVENATGVGGDKVEVPGTSAQSYLRCRTQPLEQCSLDLAVGDDWVRVYTYDETADTVTDAERSRMIALGALVVDNLT